MVASRENFPLLAELLAEQQRLDTPVARFSAAHDANAVSGAVALAPQLIPLSAPSPGEQYAFQVDLDSCTGCKSCVSACHSLNGLDDTETWRDVGLLVGGTPAKPFTQTITTACHHCADPACLNGCPVLAYEKDPVTGIVRHLDDQCIGCSYCILKCPYDVPKFSSRLGIVRKCDLCHTRLAAGEAPACAQACPTHAIRIITVPTVALALSAAGTPASATQLDLPKSELAPESKTACRPAPSQTTFRSHSPTTDFLPGAPDPAYTQPTTRYVTKRPFPYNVVAGDARTLRVQPAHAPLVVMLTLIGAAVGFWTLAVVFPHVPVATNSLAASFGQSRSLPVTLALKWAALFMASAGLGASVLHLGKPQRAWRIFLGWRKSWLSREAMLFGMWFGSATTALLVPSLDLLVALIGWAALACSAMIYVDTHRSFWRSSDTFPRFFGTALLLPLALIAPALAALGLLMKLVWETRSFFGGGISARLQRGPLARTVAFRDLLGVVTAVLLVAAPGWMALIGLLTGELIERILFFRAVDAPKMPGVPA